MGKIDMNLTENKLTSCIIDAAIEVHKVLGGPGLLESVYEIALAEHLHKVHSAQVLTYLRLTQKKLGLVLNFGQTLLRDGICRVVNNF
ncbi:MAG: GxxExxY protein [Chlamydiota bacterium]|nr:GxxExxY protein [Chlamydiota bacterium]